MNSSNHTPTNHISQEELSFNYKTPLPHKNSSQNLNTGKKEIGIINQVNCIVHDLIQFSQDISLKSQKIKINSIIESLKSVVHRLAEENISFKNKESSFVKQNNNSLLNLNSTGSNNLNNVDQSPEHSISQKANNTLPSNFLDINNNKSKNSVGRNDSIFQRSKPFVKNDIRKTIKRNKYDIGIDESLPEQLMRLNDEVEKKNNELKDYEKANKGLIEYKQKLEEDISKHLEKIQTITNENEDWNKKYLKLKTEFDEVSEIKHNLQGIFDNIKLQKYKSDVTKIKLDKQTEDMEHLVKQARDELIISVKKEQQVSRELEAKTKINQILKNKLESKSKRLLQLREINKKMENALTQLEAQKDYFDTAAEKIVETNGIIAEVKKSIIALEEENKKINLKLKKVNEERDRLINEVSEYKEKELKYINNLKTDSFNNPKRRQSKLVKVDEENQNIIEL